MCEQTEINYLDGEVVWVKLGSCWWPGEVVAPEKLPPDVLPSFRKPPIAVVKFFQEDAYEYVKNINSIYKYNCSRKHEFINKGLYMFRTKHGPMEKFPEDVIRAETAVGGDIEILTREEFQEEKKESYAGLFGDTPKKIPGSAKKGRGRGRSTDSPRVSTPTRKMKEKADYKVHILVQGPSTPTKPAEAVITPSASGTEAEAIENTCESAPKEVETQESPEKLQNVEKIVTSFTTPTVSSSGIYSCHACSFSTSRLNVLILHNKTHSVTFMPYTPSPVKKKVVKSTVKSTPSTSKSLKVSRPRKDKPEKSSKKSVQAQKRTNEDAKEIPNAKKLKTNQEIKTSLLADWDDVDEDESNDDGAAIVMAGSPEIPVAAESPAVPTPAELPSAQIPVEVKSPVEKRVEETPIEKIESTSDSKYEFCEDEDWPVEAGVGRIIPRVKNPSKRKEDTKSLSLDGDEVAREVAELLNKTTVPDLPSVPEPLKVEANFPEASIVKSPDKNTSKSESSKDAEKPLNELPPTKAIFKTKTFFRSRHSRSQDAIGKYVAEQLNAVERMDMSENEINGSDTVSSPEARESPPIEHVKVARLAPKIQLKKMKAEAAQLREKEKIEIELSKDYLPPETPNKLDEIIVTDKFSIEPVQTIEPKKKTVSSSLKDVLYPTQEIKPINEIIYQETKSLFIKDDIPPPVVEAIVTEVVTEIVTENNENNENTENTENVEHFENTENAENTENTGNTEIENVEVVVEQVDETPVTPEPIVVIQETETICEVEKTISDEKALPSEPNFENAPDKTEQPYMNESTASAVDALLSVSRDSDRVTKNIGDDPPEDLFEDDNKDNGINNFNGFNDNLNVGNNVVPPLELKQNETNEEECNVMLNSFNGNNESDLNETKELTLPEEERNKENIVETEVVIPEHQEIVAESVPSESDLQIAEALINLPATAIQNKSSENVIVVAPIEIEDVIAPDTVVVDNAYEADADMKPTEIEQPVEMVHPADIIHLAEVVLPAEIVPPPEIVLPAGIVHPPEIVLPAEIVHPPEIVLPAEIVHPPEIVHHAEIVLPTEIVLPAEIEHPAEISNPVEQALVTGNDMVRFETEQEKSENLTAAQSLVQMSESIDHKLNIVETSANEIPISDTVVKQNNGIDKLNTVEQKVASLSSDNSNELINSKSVKYETTSSKLLKILEEPCTPKVIKTAPTKQIVMPGKEKILNFDVAKQSLKGKSQSPVIIRRAASNKTLLNNINDIGPADNIILSRSNKPQQDRSSVQTYTIQTSPDTPDANTITIIQQKVRKVQKPPTKLQKIKPQNSLISQFTETKQTKQATVTSDDSIFDINSMPIVLSDDILTPESIDKMPIVMSDGNLITNSSNPPKLVQANKTKQTVVETEKQIIHKVPNKPELKTLLMNPVTDVNKVTTTPNILSKSSKLRGAKPMLIIDKATGKQKIIMTKAEPALKELKPAPTLIQSVPQSSGKAEKFLILPTASSPRPGRTQKIVIDPQTGKAHVLVSKTSDAPMNFNENKPVSAKLIPSSSDANGPTNTVMIITNAQGSQSRIVLTSEHEKILFPNKQQQQNTSQLKTITHRISTNPVNTQKQIITSVPQMKTQTRIVPKQKSAIITSKGQLIVGGRVATTAQNIAPMPEIRPGPKRIVSAEPKKIIQALHKTSEPLILLQQKSGAVVQLTAAQFEHFQRTGQIIQKMPMPMENKSIIQKTITISPGESVPSIVQKRIRKTVTESPSPMKRMKQEIAIAPTPLQIPAMPALTPLSSNVVTTVGPSISNTVSVTTSSTYPDLDNLEEMLPSTAIVRQPEPMMPQPEPVAPPPSSLSDGQLLAVPGEHFGGPPGSFYLCVEDNGTLTPIDNRPLVLENNQLVPMVVEPIPMHSTQPERRDILEAALANSDVFQEPPRDETPDFRDLNANVSVHCRVSATSTTLNQPIMTPVEVPSKVDVDPVVPANLEDGLAVIGVTPHTVPTSLELPITVTDPRIALKTTDPLSGNNYGTSLLQSNTEMTFVTAEDVPMGGPISMPLLTDDDSIGKSMPILTDEVAERTVSSVESTAGSPSSADVRESEAEEGGPWSRRLLTPGSDSSETSSEIPLQPAIQLSVSDMPRHS